jgi:hypothetical protein
MEKTPLSGGWSIATYHAVGRHELDLQVLLVAVVIVQHRCITKYVTK